MIHIDEVIKRRFHERYTVNEESGCWEWTGRLGKRGYGVLSYRSYPYGAHRVSYTIYHTQIPTGLFVCHECDNPKCVNPSHLFIGTNADNMADMKAKGRSCAGARNPNAKLTQGDIEQIRCMIDQGKTNTAIARMFGVHHSMISMIRRGKSWVA